MSYLALPASVCHPFPLADVTLGGIPCEVCLSEIVAPVLAGMFSNPDLQEQQKTQICYSLGFLVNRSVEEIVNQIGNNPQTPPVFRNAFFEV